jgi:hypothetical protein
MEMTWSCEMYVQFQRTTLHYFPENITIRNRRCVNLKFCIAYCELTHTIVIIKTGKCMLERKHQHDTFPLRITPRFVLLRDLCYKSKEYQLDCRTVAVVSTLIYVVRIQQAILGVIRNDYLEISNLCANILWEKNILFLWIPMTINWYIFLG